MRIKKMLSIVLSFVFVLSALQVQASQDNLEEDILADVYSEENKEGRNYSDPQVDGVSLSNPRYDSNNMVTYYCDGEELQEPAVTWDCVWFGSYIQDASYETDEERNRIWTKGTEKKPIKWRVLSVDGDDVFLLADKSLDCQPYDDTEREDVTWETCTLRQWLNTAEDGFYNTAFSESEKSAIISTKIINANNFEYGTDGGNDTIDKVFLLSYGDSVSSAYGFNKEKNAYDPARWGKNTAYALARGAYTSFINEKYGSWWLRSPGRDSNDASEVSSDGDSSPSHNYSPVSYALSVRPVLHISLSSSLWSYAGTVCSDGVMSTISATDNISDSSNIRLSAPRYDKNNTVAYYDDDGIEIQEPAVTWDCVWFGSYIQDASLKKDEEGNKKWTLGTEKKPIKWRVLSVDGDDVLLLADKALDCQPYNAESKAVTWKTCSLRQWLNTAEDGFYNTAFSDSEKAAIISTTIKNADNPKYGTAGGKATTDKVFLLAYEDLGNSAYGFNEDLSARDLARRAKNTSYTVAKGAFTGAGSVGGGYSYFVGNGWWWLRSPGYNSECAMMVIDTGWIDWYGHHSDICVVRPALHISLSSSLWSPAGKVCSDGTVDEMAVISSDKDKDSSSSGTTIPRKHESGVSGNYTNMVEASDKSVSELLVDVRGAEEDTGILTQYYKKGKVKSVTVAQNEVKDCTVTVNAGVKLILPAEYYNTESAIPISVSGNFLKTPAKGFKVNKRGIVTLKALKGSSKYVVKFNGGNGNTIMVNVVNMVFESADIKNLSLSSNNVLTVRPVVTKTNAKEAELKNSAGIVNGVWIVGKSTIFKKMGETVSEPKSGAKVTLNQDDSLSVTGINGKALIKLTYMLNGKKYTTTVKSVDPAKISPKNEAANKAYKEAGLLK